MKKILLKVAVIVPLLVAAFLLGMQYGNATKHGVGPGDDPCPRICCFQQPLASLPLLPQTDGHGEQTLWNACFRESPFMLCNSVNVSKQNRCLRYAMEWDGVRKRFVFDGRTIDEDKRSRIRVQMGSFWGEYYYRAAPLTKNLYIDDDSLNVRECDDQIHYQIEWDHAKQKFVDDGRLIVNGGEAFLAQMKMISGLGFRR